MSLVIFGLPIGEPFDLFNEHGIRPTDIRTHKIIGESTFKRLRNGIATVNADALNHLYALFNCQPSDLMTYIPDEESKRWAEEMLEKLASSPLSEKSCQG